MSLYSRERQVVPLRPPIERTGVSEAGLERPFHGVFCHPSSLTVRVHLDAEQRSPLDARLVLFCDAIVAPQQLHLEVAVTGQAGSPNLAARVMLAVCPVEVLSSAANERANERTSESRGKGEQCVVVRGQYPPTVVVRMNELVRQRVCHLLLRCEVVIAHNHAVWCPESPADLRVAVPYLDKVIADRAPRFRKFLYHELDKGFPGGGVVHHMLAVRRSDTGEPRRLGRLGRVRCRWLFGLVVGMVVSCAPARAFRRRRLRRPRLSCPRRAVHIHLQASAVCIQVYKVRWNSRGCVRGGTWHLPFRRIGKTGLRDAGTVLVVGGISPRR